METVNVDLQKLQQLNDRIAQTIDALNQVRMSTYGLQLQHSGAGWNQQGMSPLAGQLSGAGAGYPGFYGQPAFPGVQHSVPPMQQPMQQPVQQMPVGMYGTQAIPFAGQTTGLGISHTSPQVAQLGQVGRAATMADPSWSQRVAQTFPFVASPYPPIW